MKKFIGVAVVVAALVPAGAAISGGQPDWSLQVRGYEAGGNAFGGDECSYTNVDFGGAAETVRTVAGQPSKVNGGYAGIWHYNFCTGEELYGWGFAPNSFTGDLNGATLDVTFDAFAYRFSFDENGFPIWEDLGMRTVTVAGTMTAYGDTMSGLFNQINRWGRNMTRQRFTGQFRMAEVAGTVTIDGAAVPMQAAFGQVAKVNFGSMEMFEN